MITTISITRKQMPVRDKFVTLTVEFLSNEAKRGYTKGELYRIEVKHSPGAVIVRKESDKDNTHTYATDVMFKKNFHQF